MKTTIDKEFFEYWKGKDVAMHCKTEEEAIELCRLMYENGMSWLSDASYSGKNSWKRNKQNTCYYFNESMYGNVRCCKCTILEFSDYIVEE